MSLRARRQSVKLALFLKFRVVLVLAAAASVLCVFIVSSFRGRGADEDAKLVWIVEVVPDIVYLCIFSAVMFLWRPTSKSSAYAHYQQAVAMVDFPNDESQSDDEEFGCTVSDDDVDESNVNEMGMAVFADVPVQFDVGSDNDDGFKISDDDVDPKIMMNPI